MKKINELEKAQFLDQLEMIVDGGIDLSEGIEAIAQQIDDKEYSEALLNASKEISEGASLSMALSNSGYYDTYLINMLSVGERSGYLDSVIKELAKYYYRMHETKTKIKDALTYPSILVMMMLVVIVVLISKVLPLFRNILTSMGIDISSSVLILLEIGKNLAIIALVVLVIIFVLAMYILFTLRGKENSYIKLLERLFITKKLAYDLSIVQFAYALSLLINSGIPQENALEMCIDLCENSELKSKIKSLSDRVNNGESISDCLIDSKIFKEVYNRLLVVGIKSGHFVDTINEVALSYEKDIDQMINKLLDVIEPSLVILLSLIVGIILLSVMLPLLSVMVSLWKRDKLLSLF